MDAEAAPGLDATSTLAAALVALLGPAVQAAENGALALARSQRDLNAQLDAVTLELERFSSACAAPALGPHMAKLSELRQRMAAVNSALAALQERLERLYAAAVPGARVGALGGAFHAARTATARPAVLRDEVPLSEPILPLPERVAPLVAPRSPRPAAPPPIAASVVPGTPNTALQKLREGAAASALAASPPANSLNSFVSSAQHYDSAISSSPQPASVLRPENAAVGADEPQL